MLPLTPANNYTATIVFCGGTDLLADQWVTDWNIAGYAADKTCVKVSSSCETTADEGSTDSDSFIFSPFQMSPDVSVEWEEEDSLDTGRTMGQVSRTSVLHHRSSKRELTRLVRRLFSSSSQFIILPDGRMWMGNGAALGTAGYGSSRLFPRR